MNQDFFAQSLLPQEWPGIHYFDEQEANAVHQVLKAKSPFRFYGPNLLNEASQFENELSQFLGVTYCLGVSSGTAAIQIALSAIEVGVGDEVLIPGYFWVATVSAVIRNGAIPRLVDVDDSFSLDPDDLKKKIGPRTKAVIMVHMGGIVGRVDLVKKICDEHGLFLIEDCAQSIGASQSKKMSGSFGDIATFSFQLNKNITAGEGGAIATNNEVLYKKALAVHDLGYPRNEFGRLVLNDFSRWGIGSRMSEITAAILRVQLKKLPVIIETMRNFNLKLQKILNDRSIVTRTIIDSNGFSGGFLEVILDTDIKAKIFKEVLLSNGAIGGQNSLYPIVMTEWGLHIYYNIGSLVEKKSFSGNSSVWELQENLFGKSYTYDKGTLPHLDSLISRTVIFCIASKLTEAQKDIIERAMLLACMAVKAEVNEILC